MLDRQLAAGKVTSVDLMRLAELVANFHGGGETNAEINRFGGIDVIRDNWQENFEQINPYVNETITPRQLQHCHTYVTQQLEKKLPVFATRLATGRIRDCHGDLRAESVWRAADGHFEIFDCIEFNERFRYGDVASEVAFLASDLDWRGRPDLAWNWVDSYVRASADHTLLDVLSFYKCYRAFVRGKVESFATHEKEFQRQEASAHAEVARQHFELAELYAIRLKPTLVLLCGSVGTGKTTLARAISSLLSIPTVASDVVRKELAGMPSTQHQHAAFGTALYAPEMVKATYQALDEQAGEILRGGRSVILDATFGRIEDRATAIALARDNGAQYVVLRTVAPENVVLDRVTRRQLDPTNPSDAGPDILKQMQASFRPPDEIEPDHLGTIDMSGSLRDAAREAITKIRQLSEVPAD